MERLEELSINLILSKLEPKEIAYMGCTAKRFNEFSYEDNLWAKSCFDQLHLTTPIDPIGNICPTFKSTYQAWREAFRMYPWTLVRRVIVCLDRLKMWLGTNFPEAYATLRGGASEDEINELETSLNIKLPLPMRVLYRFCDGQELKNEQFNRELDGCPLGIIGGYSCLDNISNVYLLPLKRVILKTENIRNRMQSKFNFISESIVVASTSTLSSKKFLLNCANGQLYVGSQFLVSDGQIMPCVPETLINSGDAILLWLEEHVRRLENGIIKIRDEGKFRTISLFPEEESLCSTAVTNGIKVRASACFMPEITDLEEVSRGYLFAYSIRMSLLSDRCNVHGKSFDFCQLSSRRWVIRFNNIVVNEYTGDGVIGKYPFLSSAQREYVYQSCTSLPTSFGSLEGSFTFVPGSLAVPKGDLFEVEVARFPTNLPDFIF